MTSIAHTPHRGTRSTSTREGRHQHAGRLIWGVALAALVVVIALTVALVSNSGGDDITPQEMLQIEQDAHLEGLQRTYMGRTIDEPPLGE